MSPRSFEELAQHRVRGRDYTITVRRRPESLVAVIAPHGGRIEPGTSKIAAAIAGADLNLYLFEGTMAAGNYEALHLTSHRFDEPECLALLTGTKTVVAVHGCTHSDEVVLLGGLDASLKGQMAAALRKAGIHAKCEGHQFQASDPSNICNRGASRQGVQLEISAPLRRSERLPRAVQAIRAVLLSPI